MRQNLWTREFEWEVQQQVFIYLFISLTQKAMSSWIPEFLAYCHNNSVSYDFISTHEYPTGILSGLTLFYCPQILQDLKHVNSSRMY